MQCRHFTIRLSPQHLLEDEERLNEFLRQVQVHSFQTSLAAPKGDRLSVLVFFESLARKAPVRRQEQERPHIDDEGESELTAEEQQIYERLREWRSERAKSEGVPPYVVAHNAALRYIARHHMSMAAAEDLAPIKQFGAQKAARYGADILQLLKLQETGGDEGLFDEDYTA